MAREEAPFAELPGGVAIARYFWHEVALKDRDGRHRPGNYHGADGITLWRDEGTSDYCYLWVESTVDLDMWACYLLDVRTKVRANAESPDDKFFETRDYLWLVAGAGEVFEAEWRNHPIRFDAPTDDHIDNLRDGLAWFGARVVGFVERQNEEKD